MNQLGLDTELEPSAHYNVKTKRDLNPDLLLLTAIIFSFFSALTILLTILVIYLRNKSFEDLDVPMLKAILHDAVFRILPIVSGGYLLVGWLAWRYRALTKKKLKEASNANH